MSYVMCSINYHYHIVTIIVIMCDSVGERERERIGYRCAIFNIVFVHAMLSFFFWDGMGAELLQPPWTGDVIAVVPVFPFSLYLYLDRLCGFLLVCCLGHYSDYISAILLLLLLLLLLAKFKW